MSSRRTRSLQPIALTAPASSQRRVASRISARLDLADDGEHAAHRLERAQRLLELASSEDQRGARRVVRERGAQRARRSSAPPGRCRGRGTAITSVSVRPTGRRRGAHSERGRPIRVRTIGVAISRPASRRSTRCPRSTRSVRRRDDRAARRAQRRDAGADEAARRRSRRGSAATSRGIGERQRLAHEAAHQRRADGGLQRRREGDGDRHGSTAIGIVRGRATRRARALTANAPRATAAEHAPAEDQHARQRDAGGRVERRRVARRDRQLQRQPGRRRHTPARSGRAAGQPLQSSARAGGGVRHRRASLERRRVDVANGRGRGV